MSQILHIAALLQTEQVRADSLLHQVVTIRRGQGWHIRGLLALPDSPDGTGFSAKPPCIQDIHTGQHYAILQGRGPGARGCKLDSRVLIQAGSALRDALPARPDLVIVNRFGTSEAEGNGLLNEILDLASAGIPVLTIVTDRYQPAWRHFVGDDRHELPCTMDALDAWLDALPASQRASHASVPQQPTPGVPA